MSKQKTALVCGAAGFIGHHLVKQLSEQGVWVRGVDLKHNPHAKTLANDFVIGDLRDRAVCAALFDRHFDAVYQLAADMGGAGYIFTGDNDANIMHNSAQINLNVLECCRLGSIGQIFYSSSACIYPGFNQKNTSDPTTYEASAYPADPDSEYGWEKLFSERMYFAYQRCYGLTVKVARFHNIFGPEGSWNDGLEKAPAAICRKVAMAEDNGEIDVWGDGEQTRSFLFIDECLEGVQRFMQGEFSGPLNIGSEEMVSINQLAAMAMTIAGKSLSIRHIDGPLGVRGRNSDNTLMREKLAWAPSQPLAKGLETTYHWIAEQVQALVARTA